MYTTRDEGASDFEGDITSSRDVDSREREVPRNRMGDLGALSFERDSIASSRLGSSITLESVECSSQVKVGKELFAKVIITSHQFENGDRAVIQTAIHTENEPNTIGGMRIVPCRHDQLSENDIERGLQEVGSLSSAMTYKCDLAGLPCGGQKTVALYDGELGELSAEQRADLLAQHIKEAVKYAPTTLFGPDMAVGEEVQDAIVTRYPAIAKHIIGVSERQDGLGIDKYGYTAQGVKAAIDFSVEKNNLEPKDCRMVIAGFGAVGAHVANLADVHGYPVVAISNRFGTIHNDGKPLPIAELFNAWSEWYEVVEGQGIPQTANADEAVLAAAKISDLKIEGGDTKALLSYEAEIMVLAARTKEIGADSELSSLRKENPDSLPLNTVLQNTSLKIIAQGANAPLGEHAEEMAIKQGISILPDTAINGGGVIGCYVGWKKRTDSLQKKAGKGAEDIRSELFARIHSQVRTNLSEIDQKLVEGSELRKGMLEIAEERGTNS